MRNFTTIIGGIILGSMIVLPLFLLEHTFNMNPYLIYALYCIACIYISYRERKSIPYKVVVLKPCPVEKVDRKLSIVKDDK